MSLSKKTKNKRGNSSKKLSLTKTSRIYTEGLLEELTGVINTRQQYFDSTGTVESMKTSEASDIQVQTKSASKCCLAGLSNLTINIQHIWGHWSLCPSKLLWNIISFRQIKPHRPSVIRKMGFRTIAETIFACDPLSSISLAFLSFAEEINMHERNEVGKHWLGKREGSKHNRLLAWRKKCKTIMSRRKGKIILKVVFMFGNVLLTYLSEPMYSGRSYGN